jgi:hypothetical protein
MGWTLTPLGKAGLAVLGVLAAALIALSLTQNCKEIKTGKLIVQAQVQAVQAAGHAGAAVEVDRRVDDLQAALVASKAEVARLKAVLKAKQASAQKIEATTALQPMGGPAPAAQIVVQEVDPLKDQLIEAQDRRIGLLETQVGNLTRARDEWKAAYEARSREAVARELALEAQIAATKASRWRGRIEGFAVGIAVGYVGGRLR